MKDNESDVNSQEETTESEFDWLANVYTRQGAMNHPSELHGVLVGELAGGLKRTAGDWINQVKEHMGLDELNSNVQANIVEDLISFYQRNLEGIDKDSSSFALLLPDDDYQLSERLDSLAQWVRGFLEGIAISASKKLNLMPSELQEILQDLVEISQLDSRVEAGEEGEREFFEVSEYVRIGVLNLYAEFNVPVSEESDEKTDSKPTLH